MGPCRSLLVLVFLALGATAAAEDVQLRQRAVTMLEHANGVTMVREFASYEQTIRFQSLSAAGTKDGLFTSVVQGPRSYRDEYQFGDYHLLVVVNGEMIADVGDRAKAPFEIRELTRLNRPYQGRFDHTDVIRSIEPSTVNGRPAECIEFDTVAGEKTEQNEICFDKQIGAILRLHANGETLSFSGYFPYRTAYVPAHISYEQNDVRMELEQTKVVTEGPIDPNLLVPPANATVGYVCKTYRRPYGTFMPQPKSGTEGARADVLLHGTVRIDGSVRDASIEHSERADLNDEAVKIFSTWVFSPAMCDGKPTEVPADAILHFQGR